MMLKKGQNRPKTSKTLSTDWAIDWPNRVIGWCSPTTCWPSWATSRGSTDLTYCNQLIDWDKPITIGQPKRSTN